MTGPIDEHDDDERYLTRREAEILIANTVAAENERNEAHLREHRKEVEAVDKALAAKADQQTQHNVAHDKAHDSHEEKHRSENKAVETALAALDRERKIHADAHTREHEGHQREHGLNNLAIDKAEAANDKRFAGVNATRAQMDDILRTLTSQDAFNALVSDFARYREDSRKDLDRRLSEQLALITGVRENDIKGQGKSIGQGAVIAAIVGSVAFASTLLGILVIASNLLTGLP